MFCSAIVKGIGENIHSVPKEKRLRPEVRDVKEEGDHASGVLKFVMANPDTDPAKKEPAEPLGEMVLAFKKSKDGWRIELPPLNQLLSEAKK